MDTPTSHLQTESGRKLQETLDRVARGIRDPEAARQAREWMERERDEMRKRLGGPVEVVVDLVRELRDS